MGDDHEEKVRIRMCIFTPALTDSFWLVQLAVYVLGIALIVLSDRHLCVRREFGR